MKRVIFRSALWAGLSLVLIAAAMSVGQSAAIMLGDAEAQALIRKYQGRPATPLTRIETQNLLRYLITKNANPSASPAVQAQPQSGGTSTRAIALTTLQLPVQAVAETKKPKLTRIGIALPKADLGQGFQGPTAGESLRLLESRLTLRNYARQKYKKEIYITANGVFPFVDFQMIGLWGGNPDGPGGSSVNYCPHTAAGHLDGTQSLLAAFMAMKQRSARIDGRVVPVAAFIDWPTDVMTAYLSLPDAYSDTQSPPGPPAHTSASSPISPDWLLACNVQQGLYAGAGHG